MSSLTSRRIPGLALVSALIMFCSVLSVPTAAMASQGSRKAKLQPKASPPGGGVHEGADPGPKYKPLVVVPERNTDSPLVISVDDIDATDPYSPEVSFRVRNADPKRVLAYAIQVRELSCSNAMSAASLVITLDSDRPFGSGEVRTDSFGGLAMSTPVERMEISVDYVRFVDGIQWGPDVGQSSKRLSGVQAGVRSVAEFISNLLEQRPLEDVLSAITGDLPAPSPEEIVSSADAQWNAGFSSGRRLAQERLRRLTVSAPTPLDLEILLLDFKRFGGEK